ncbi:hypothetical protein BRADI_1g57525v3 [Brachypodium distachyon]|uniref:Uncharacterized protein n=1 Tax=Brachypodium distachyon TaxID=15368 RepID=A0A2K2DS30_BRADI|nr:hypothetical protein BRADI_1g57525v3 [Brachypodium distachyon]
MYSLRSILIVKILHVSRRFSYLSKFETIGGSMYYVASGGWSTQLCHRHRPGGSMVARVRHGLVLASVRCAHGWSHRGGTTGTCPGSRPPSAELRRTMVKDGRVWNLLCPRRRRTIE